MNRQKPEINTERGSGGPPAAPRSRLRFAAPLLAILLFAAAWFAWQRFPAGTGLDPSAARPAAGALSGAEAGGARVASPSGGVYYGPPGSLAVLPFEDRSPAGGQQAQATGFAFELVSRLQQVPALQVTAPSSSFFFGGGTTPPRIVSERLQSRFLLTGEWSAEGERFRVSAALFDARRGETVWRQELDGNLAGVLQSRDELARAALEALPSAAAPEWPAAATVIPDDWSLLQTGRWLADPLGAADLAAGAASIHLVLEHEPDNAAALVAMARTWLHPSWPGSGDATVVEDARAAVAQVLARDPPAAAVDRAQAWGLLAYIRHRHDWAWREAAEAAGQALSLAPGDAGLLALASLAHFTLGEHATALELLEASVQRDPLNLGSRLRLGLVQEFSGQYDEALASYRQVLSLREDYPAAHAYRARVKVLQDKADSALRESGQESDPFWRRYAETLALVAAGRHDEAEPLLERMMAEDGDTAAFQVAEILAWDGQVEQAFEWLLRAWRQRDPGLSALLENPMLRGLQDDVRWMDLRQRVGLPPDPTAAD